MAKNLDESAKQYEALNSILRDGNTILNERNRTEEIYANNQKLINDYKANANKLTSTQQEHLNKLLAEQRKINVEVNNETKIRQRNNKILGETNSQLGLIFKSLTQSDKIIRQTILSLGMSGTKAEMMRSSFEKSALQVAHLGGNLQDVQDIMVGYAEETGRARALTADMVKDITLIGKGTGLGVEQATKLGAQFEIMGFDAKRTMEYVQGVVDTSERMGVNTTKVLKNVSDNFKKLNTYTFQQGVKGMAQMAMYAEKFKVDIGDALNAADVAKSLEGAIGLAAQLQVMGGEFAKTDPFEMLFLSRNDPAKFTEKIADMTKGVVSFRKMSDGTFEKFISPADRDRLAGVAKSLGMEASKLTEIALRQAEIQKMRQQMQGMGLSDEQKELVEGAATFDKKSGKFQVELAGTMRDISTLTKDQAKSFVTERKSLEERGIAAQDFETALKSTIEEFKSILLPMLRGVNSFLTTVRPVFSGLAKAIDWVAKSDLGASLLKFGGMLMAGGFLLNMAATKLTGKGLLEQFSKEGGRGGVGSVLSSNADMGRNGKPLGVGAQKAFDIGQVNRANAGAGLAKAKGMQNLATGGGIAVAAVGIGAGVAAAAVGISKLADAMSKLKPEQAEALQGIVRSITILVGVGAAAGVAIAAFGAGATAASGGLLAFGAAVFMVGAGIGVAAAGIGVMGMGIGQMIESSKGAGDNMMQLATGIGAISLAMLGMTGGIGGVLTFSLLMNRIAKNAPAIAQVGEAFKQINAVMSGSKDDFIAVENAVKSISNMNTKGGSAFAELATLLKTPLKVEFADKNVAIVSNISMDIDGQVVFKKSYKTQSAISAAKGLTTGKGGQ